MKPDKASYQELIDQAFNNKKLFFKPWIGEYYGKGVKLFNSKHQFKIMVIGASRYCEYIANGNPCSYESDCCKCNDYDKMKSIADNCSYLNIIKASDSSCKGLRLYDINTACLRKSCNGNPFEAYKNFQSFMATFLNSNNPKEIWNYLSFVNAYEPIVPRGQKKRTPPYLDFKNEYKKSGRVIATEIDILEPDIIFLWRSEQIYAALDDLFPQKKDIKIEPYNYRTKHPYNSYDINGIRLLTIPHPTFSKKDYVDYVDYINRSKTMMMCEFVTPYTINNTLYFSNPLKDIYNELEEYVNTLND